MSTSNAPSPRQRISPRERFAGDEKVFRLDEEFARLPQESTPRHGHMQKALYRHGPITTGIWTFEAGGGIDQHVLAGESILHVLAGRVTVRTPASEYTLGPNEVLLLDPGVTHDIKAVEPTRLMMTFVLISQATD